MVKKNKLLDDYLDDLDLDDNLKKILSVISNTCYKISEAIRSSNINNLVGKTGEINVQGEQVEKLDEFSNDLKEFGVDTDEPDLFNSNTHTSNSDDLLNTVLNNDSLSWIENKKDKYFR